MGRDWPLKPPELRAGFSIAMVISSSLECLILFPLLRYEIESKAVVTTNLAFG
jgi:hypothetical protein